MALASKALSESVTKTKQQRKLIPVQPIQLLKLQPQTYNKQLDTNGDGVDEWVETNGRGNDDYLCMEYEGARPHH